MAKYIRKNASEIFIICDIANLEITFEDYHFWIAIESRYLYIYLFGIPIEYISYSIQFNLIYLL